MMTVRADIYGIRSAQQAIYVTVLLARFAHGGWEKFGD
jgi:hypothetical protein